MDASSQVVWGDDFPCASFIKPAHFQLTTTSSLALQLAFSIVAILMCLPTVAANILVIVSILRTPSLNSPPNILVVGLAFSDLGVGLLSLPTFILSRFAKVIQDAPLFCKTAETGISAVCLGLVSLLTLSAVSLDRYVAIHYHLRYQGIVTVKRVRGILITIWALGSVCGLAYGIERTDLLMVGLNVSLFLSFAIIISSNCSIHVVVRRHQRQIASQMRVQAQSGGGSPLSLARFKRSFTNLQILLWSLLLCYLPFSVITGVVAATGSSPAKQNALELGMLLVCLNSTLNPFIYCWRCQPIRVAFLRLLRDISCRHSTH